MTVGRLINKLSLLDPALPLAVAFADCDGDEFALMPDDPVVMDRKEVFDKYGLDILFYEGKDVTVLSTI